MNQKTKSQPRKGLETFEGRVQNTILSAGIGWIECTKVNGEDSNDVLFFHENYTEAGVLPAVRAKVKGNISRTADPAKQDRAIDVEVV